jgi:flagellar basal body rod protein FlgG
MGTSVTPTGTDALGAALGMIELRQQVVANNLANVSTVGFKGGRTFATLLDDASTPAADMTLDMRAGTIDVTGNALDLALDGVLLGADACRRTPYPRG